MCWHCVNSDPNIISRRTFLKESASLLELKTMLIFKLDVYVQKAMALKALYFFYQKSNLSNLSLLNLLLSSMKWSLSHPTRPKTRLKY